MIDTVTAKSMTYVTQHKCNRNYDHELYLSKTCMKIVTIYHLRVRKHMNIKTIKNELQCITQRLDDFASHIALLRDPSTYIQIVICFDKS